MPGANPWLDMFIKRYKMPQWTTNVLPETFVNGVKNNGWMFHPDFLTEWMDMRDVMGGPNAPAMFKPLGEIGDVLSPRVKNMFGKSNMFNNVLGNEVFFANAYPHDGKHYPDLDFGNPMNHDLGSVVTAKWPSLSQMVLNPGKITDPATLTDTFLHESRHLMDQYAAHKLPGDYYDYLKAMDAATSWDDMFDVYYNSPSETRARSFADQVIGHMGKRSFGWKSHLRK